MARKTSKAKPKAEKVAIVGYDRRATELPMNADVRPVVVDDPLEAGAKLTMLASIRGDPLGRMHARRQIDDAQYHAGRHLQNLFEASELGGIKAMDTTKEPVDGGHGIPELITEHQRKAVTKLGQLSGRIGQNRFSLLRDFLADRLFIKDCALRRGLYLDQEVRALGIELQAGLESAAVELGYA